MAVQILKVNSKNVINKRMTTGIHWTSSPPAIVLRKFKKLIESKKFKGTIT